MQLKVFNKEFIKKFLLLGFVLTIPNSVAINNIFLGFIFIYWLFICNKSEFISLLKNNIISLLSILFLITFIVSFIYTQNIYNGFIIFSKEIKFLFIPIFMQFLKNENINLYLKTFVISMMFDEILSYLIFFKIMPPMFKADSSDPAVFMGHIAYNPFLAFTIFILIHEIFKEKIKGKSLLISIFFLFTMTVNMFITGGRAGYVAFLIILIVGSFLIAKSKKELVIFIIFIAIIFISAYKFSPIVHKRVNLAIYNISHYENHKNSSVGKRMTFWLNTIEMIKQHPVLGAGCGDFKDEYKIINNKNTPFFVIASQPHNMYLFIWAINGLFGIIVLLLLFIYMFICAFKINDRYKELRIIFVLLFVIINFSDSYLLGHYTTSLFVFFTALFFKDCKWKKFQ